MLDIGFYTTEGKPIHHVEAAENFLEGLARSEFAKIGKEQMITVLIDDEKIDLPLVKLGNVNRHKFIAFFTSAIVDETKILLNQIRDYLAKPERVYRLRKLIEILAQGVTSRPKA
ncbi:MAG TPA: hypothetical protein DCL61_02945 [Cyanobacteria bacterium UBA12227]|nr:hypothetical protein [Cyanobacteria bacterium UBA12227]HAX86749.1 hypothetical protein [Cyanobacteria bacterium UBA11370]HBY81387.1 hypothetical protein [Cyanobacteria bacterium UBA11148]